MQQKRRGRPAKVQNVVHVPSLIDFGQITMLNQLNIDRRMLESMETESKVVNQLFSEEGGIPCASNYMMIGDPGVGKTTVLLDVLAMVQNHNKQRKCLFISGEMGRKQMFKYTERFPQFGFVKTLFMADYLEYNTKDVFEQVLNIFCIFVSFCESCVQFCLVVYGLVELREVLKGWYVVVECCKVL
jgi:predicted ATP-dependent serine protease